MSKKTVTAPSTAHLNARPSTWKIRGSAQGNIQPLHTCVPEALKITVQLEPRWYAEGAHLTARVGETLACALYPSPCLREINVYRGASWFALWRGAPIWQNFGAQIGSIMPGALWHKHVFRFHSAPLHVALEDLDAEGARWDRPCGGEGNKPLLQAAQHYAFPTCQEERTVLVYVSHEEYALRYGDPAPKSLGDALIKGALTLTLTLEHAHATYTSSQVDTDIQGRIWVTLVPIAIKPQLST